MAFSKFPLSDYEMEQIDVIEKHIKPSSSVFMLSDEEVSACFDAIETLEQRNIIVDFDVDQCNMYLLKGSFAEFKKWIQSQNDKAQEQAARGGEMQMAFEPLTKNCEQLLRDILEHRDAKGNCDTDYWKQRFDGLSTVEDGLLRSQFGVLADRKMINILWADNVPYYLEAKELGVSYFEQKDNFHNQIKAVQVNKAGKAKEYDVFISHASKDKLDYVDELYSAIRKLGVRVFYDTEEVSWGDDWKQTIIEGTEKSEFAIIVISNNFFGREWTERELNEFLKKQNSSGQKVVLPLLHDVTVSEMREHYPALGTIQVLETKDYSMSDIVILFAKEMIKRLRKS